MLLAIQLWPRWIPRAITMRNLPAWCLMCLTVSDGVFRKAESSSRCPAAGLKQPHQPVSDAAADGDGQHPRPHHSFDDAPFDRGETFGGSHSHNRSGNVVRG